MSGGRPSRPQTAEGDHPSCTNEVRKDGETAGCARNASAGLGLDGGWGHRPLKQKQKSQPEGWHSFSRKGSKPDGRDGFSRLDSREPGLKGCARIFQEIVIESGHPPFVVLGSTSSLAIT